MYDNIGEKIKGVTFGITVFSMIIVGAFFLIASIGMGNGIFFFVGIFALVLIWASSLTIYALGQIASNTDKMVKNQETIIELLEKPNISENARDIDLPEI